MPNDLLNRTRSGFRLRAVRLKADHPPGRLRDIASLLCAESDTTTRSGSPAFPHLVAIVVHGHQAQQMVHVAALAKLAHQLGLEAFVLQDAFIAGGHEQPLHADGAILKEPESRLHQRLHVAETSLLGWDAQTVRPVHVRAFLTSSGNTLIFSVYLFTTSSGFFPSHTNRGEKGGGGEGKKTQS